MMDSQTCADQSRESGNESNGSVERINSKNASCESPKANVLLPLGPVTPDSNKEIGDAPFDLKSSPLSGLNTVRKMICFAADSSDNINALFASTDCSSPRTPTGGVFDPFAPGPEDMMLAPRCKKPICQPKMSVSRRLVFCSNGDVAEDGDYCEDAISLSDEEMFESVYENLLEVIITTQTEGVLAELSKEEWDSDDCKTPPLAPHIKGIAETCPGAPMKRAGKAKNIELGLCRKLEF